MVLTIKKLRVAMLVSAGLLGLTVAAFLGYARYRARGFLLKLPGKLGIDIQQQADGFTYSQSVQGKTVYTIHAAKAVQHHDGKWTLHDVGITLYGQNQDRADHIYGSEFEYDKKAGHIVAAGEVQIDLAAAPGLDKFGKKDTRVLHIKTSGLSFDEHTHRALTTQRIDFNATGYTGHAVGADYNSESGRIVLGSEVVVSGVMEEKPVVLNAAHAELNQKANTVDLIAARYIAVSQGTGEETVTARHAIIHTDEDNNPEHIEAEGAVTLSGGGRGTLVADHADALLQHGHAQTTHLFGHLHYAEDDPLRQAAGEAQDARISFDSLGRASHIVVAGDVFGRQQLAESVRELHAAKVELAFAAEGKQPSVLQDAQATTGVRLHMVDRVLQKASKARGTAVSDVSGDRLTAHFDIVGRTARLATMHGAGDTVLHRVDERGTESTSKGRLLDVSFEPQVTKLGISKPNAAAVVVRRATQTGSVTLMRTTADKPGTASATQRGSADEAVYDAASDVATLTGSAELADATSAVMAQHIVISHESGDATADGGVRTTYLQPVSPNQAVAATPPAPVHVLSDRAVLHHDDGIALFYGKPARMWQSGTQVEAPILEFDQDRHTLFAHSAVVVDNAAVHAVLVPAAKPGSKSPLKPGEPVSQGPIRVLCRELTYNDGTRQIDLRGSVQVEDADGTMRARQATIFLQPIAKSGPPPSGPPAIAIPGGQIDHIVATGNIEIKQPGRVASGEQLVYTASGGTTGDGLFVLTGTAAFPPKVVDDAQGTVTGDSLRFKTGDDSVLVTGGGGTKRVHTVTQMKQ